MPGDGLFESRADMVSVNCGNEMAQLSKVSKGSALETHSQVLPGHKVIVADDERVIADTLAVILNQSGFEAIAVYDGRQAVDKARCWKPDLLVSDVVMPELSGIDAAIQICSMLPECKVLLFSGQAKTGDMLNDARVRGHQFQVLPKPVHPADLIAELRSL